MSGSRGVALSWAAPASWVRADQACPLAGESEDPGLRSITSQSSLDHSSAEVPPAPPPLVWSFLGGLTSHPSAGFAFLDLEPITGSHAHTVSLVIGSWELASSQPHSSLLPFILGSGSPTALG